MLRNEVAIIWPNISLFQSSQVSIAIMFFDEVLKNLTETLKRVSMHLLLIVTLRVVTYSLSRNKQTISDDWFGCMRSKLVSSEIVSY